jgi:transposase, IS5 family
VFCIRSAHLHTGQRISVRTTGLIHDRIRSHAGAASTPLVRPGESTPSLLSGNQQFADSAYRGNHFCDAVLAKGGIPRIVATGMWGRDEAETLRKLHEWNQPIHRVRARIEKIFGTWKRCYGLRRMRWRGLAKAAVQVRLTAIAYNLKRTMNILSVPA